MILLSAGHFPEKPGACFESFCEFDEADRWVNRIIELVNDHRVIRVPPTPLKGKVAFINARESQLAIELHFNSAVNAAGEHIGSGACVLHHPNSSNGISFAELFFGVVEPIFGKHWNGVMPGWYRMDEKFGPDFFLDRTRCPAIIIEPEFIHNKETILKYREVTCHNLAQTIKTLL